MKKILAVIFAISIAALLLASCGGNSPMNEIFWYGDGGSTASSSGGSSMTVMEPSAPMAPPAPGGDYYGEMMSDTQYEGSGVVSMVSSATDENLAEKIIYTVYADIETMNFDETIDRVYELLSQNRAFIESSYVGGKNLSHMYYGWQTYRNANFTLRVPKDRLVEITAGLDYLGNVTSLRSDSQNITAQFTDTEARLRTLAIQEERLLDMLMKAEDVPDMIAIEERLSNVRYQIESMTATLRNWQNQVDYSTLNLSINEVEEFTEIVQLQQRTYWQQIGEGLQATTWNVGLFFMDLFKWFAVNLPVLAILVIIIVVVVIIIRRKLRRSRNKHSGSVDSQ